MVVVSIYGEDSDTEKYLVLRNWEKEKQCLQASSGRSEGRREVS